MKTHLFSLLFLSLGMIACDNDLEYKSVTKSDHASLTESYIRHFSFSSDPALQSYTFRIEQTETPGVWEISNQVDSLPIGTDISALKAVFEVTDDQLVVTVDGVVQESGVSVQDFSEPVIYEASVPGSSDKKTYVMKVNVAKTDHNPDKYIILHLSDFRPSIASKDHMKEIARIFGSQTYKKKIGVGVAFTVMALNYKREDVDNDLNYYLSRAQEYKLPVLIQIDVEQYWAAYKKIYNWWDPSDAETYNPDNIRNVERFGWGETDAVKWGWRNWGSQQAVNPMPNLRSPEYIAAAHGELRRVLTRVMEWKNSLPPEDKRLFIGVKVGWESGIGVNNYYYDGGNDINAKDHTRITAANTPSSFTLDQAQWDTDYPPSMSHNGKILALGLAAAKEMGLLEEGDMGITGEMQTAVTQKHLEELAKICNEEFDIPRRQVFSHAFSNVTNWKAPLNQYSCPGWSFYSYAYNPTEMDPYVSQGIAQNDAPYWTAAEWLFRPSSTHPDTEENWIQAFTNTLGENTRLVTIYNWNNSIEISATAQAAIKKLNK
ncbi:hypothetical protein [Alistipes senegalensis]|uniref:hypothetical protein n=1 Tax=Alistipes senegalensis TaxID=1288121 RepID=UPI0018A90D0B|nr:hypothetical protein [Alistipes senegalensis]